MELEPGQLHGEGDWSEHGDDIEVFRCKACEAVYIHEKHLKRHQLYRCLKQPIPLDPIQLYSRRQNQISHNADNDSETHVTIYKIDNEAEKFIATCSNSYAKFRLCELKQNPLAISGFWPILFDYRGNTALGPIDSYLGHHSRGIQILAQILTDGYNFYGEKSITISRVACVEQNGLYYSISDYRYPVTATRDSGLIRKDRPFFQVEKSMHEVTLSFHPDYFSLIMPSPFISTDSEEIVRQNSEDSHQNTPEDSIVDEDTCIDLLFSQVSLEDVDDVGQNLSQKLSQVSLESSPAEEVQTSPVRKVCEPVSKKPKFDKLKSTGQNKVKLVHGLPSVRLKTITCSLCGAVLTGGVSQLNR